MTGKCRYTEAFGFNWLSQSIGRHVQPWDSRIAVRRLMGLLPVSSISDKSRSVRGSGPCSFEPIDYKWGLIPDGWFIEPQSSAMLSWCNPNVHTLCLVEVVDSVDLGEERIAKYWELRSCFDDLEYWELELFGVFPRKCSYGLADFNSMRSDGSIESRDGFGIWRCLEYMRRRHSHIDRDFLSALDRSVFPVSLQPSSDFGRVYSQIVKGE